MRVNGSECSWEHPVYTETAYYTDVTSESRIVFIMYHIHTKVYNELFGLV